MKNTEVLYPLVLSIKVYLPSPYPMKKTSVSMIFILNTKYSLKSIPQIQPYISLGIQLASPLRAGVSVEAERFSHNTYYGMLGGSFIQKFNKQLEMGGGSLCRFGSGNLSQYRSGDGRSPGEHWNSWPERAELPPLI